MTPPTASAPDPNQDRSPDSGDDPAALVALQRATRALGGLLLVFALLVATHLGEFWPFSIFPMFSQSGNPWTRALVMDVTDAPDDALWGIGPVEDLPGTHFPLRAFGIDQIDYANFVVKTDTWDQTRVDALRNMLGERAISDRRLLVVRVSGELSGPDTVEITATPFMLLTPDTHTFNPALRVATGEGTP